jgi:hypothetical protein
LTFLVRAKNLARQSTVSDTLKAVGNEGDGWLPILAKLGVSFIW